MRIPPGSNPFEYLAANVTETIRIEEDFVVRFERHRRRDLILAGVLLVVGTVIAAMGNWLGIVYLLLSVGMVGMAFHAQFNVIRTRGWIDDWRTDLALFQLGAIEWEHGEWPEWVIRRAEASGRYYFSEG